MLAAARLPCLDELCLPRGGLGGGSGPRGGMAYSVLHSKDIFEELGDLPQPSALHERPMAQAVLLSPRAARALPLAESAPLPLLPEEQLQELVQQRDLMVLNSHMAEKAARAAQEAAQMAAVAQRKAERAQKKAQKAAQPTRPRGRPKKYVGPAAEEQRLAVRATYIREKRQERAAEDPAGWRASLDDRAKREREAYRDRATKDPAAWRAKLDDRAQKEQVRWHVKNPGARRMPRWTQHEDNMLLQLVQRVGPKWTHIATQLPRRVGPDAVRERYNYITTVESVV